ncbi:hypothetical protein GALMADRAFT_225056 [Galerina marginata CBS 339.88]|uniref:Peptidase S1 domain-containing protein n=1 Tax=Galerina marginata (strain CBS 339.88) TaxID=685588 RepID=A0A067T126_GALM3|nr:hypothetical protein GALMADRAFT_225056 [Galerina marginata CBS 339.88]
MDPAYQNKKIVDLSDAELIALEFLGENVDPAVKYIVDKVKAHPDHLGTVTCFMVDCLKRWGTRPASPTSPLREADSELSNNSDLHTVVAPNLISKYEMNFWYHGISGDPPKLMWRSDLETNHFPTRPRGARFFKIPTKTAHGVFNTPLNKVWDDPVAPRILASMKARGLKYSALKTVRFSIVEDGKDDETLGPIVVWIAVRPNTTNAAAVRDATPDILHILGDVQITDVVVEWYEASVVRLVGPPLMSVEDRTSPMFGLNHPFNTGLGIPIARQSDGAQGTLTLLFKEMKTSSGDPSERILALTNKHVASVDTTTDYEFDGANPQHILVCGDRRLACAISEIEDAITTGLRDVVGLAGGVEDLESKLGTPKENKTALRRNKNALYEKNEDNTTLQPFFAEVNADWQDTNGRRLGVVDWAPKISVGVNDHRYTRDIATFVVDRKKLENFERNIIDLGDQYTAGQLEDLFWPIAAIREGRTIPADLQLPVRRALTPRLHINPDTEDKNGDPLYIVGKYGNTTKLTLGHYSGMDAYICTDLGLESREMVVYNYSKTSGKTSGNFSDHGDSGSLIFTGDGDALAILHSGMPRGVDNHVTYGTPIWWVIKQILDKYPFAEFYGTTYSLD